MRVHVYQKLQINLDENHELNMNDEFWLILKSQPGVGVLIVDREGIVLFRNEQAKEIYYGLNCNPLSMTIEQVEGPEFAAERMPVIQKVLQIGEPIVLSHVRGGIDITPAQTPEWFRCSNQRLPRPHPDDSGTGHKDWKAGDASWDRMPGAARVGNRLRLR